MNQNIDLNEIERKAWTSYFEDGLWDIFWGLMMLTMGIRELTDNIWFTIGFIPAVLITVIGKKFITVPRIGRVKFGPTRRAKRVKLFAVIIFSVAATLALMLLSTSGLTLPQIPISPIMAIFLAVIVGLIAYYMDFVRLYAYGIMLAISEVLWGLFGKPIGPTAQVVSGIVALLVGLVVLIRFLHKYHIPKGDELND